MKRLLIAATLALGALAGSEMQATAGGFGFTIGLRFDWTCNKGGCGPQGCGPSGPYAGEGGGYPMPGYGGFDGGMPSYGGMPAPQGYPTYPNHGGQLPYGNFNAPAGTNNGSGGTNILPAPSQPMPPVTSNFGNYGNFGGFGGYPTSTITPAVSISAE